MKLEGYLVNKNFEIKFPVSRRIVNVKDKTIKDLENEKNCIIN